MLGSNGMNEERAIVKINVVAHKNNSLVQRLDGSTVQQSGD